MFQSKEFSRLGMLSACMVTISLHCMRDLKSAAESSKPVAQPPTPLKSDDTPSKPVHPMLVDHKRDVEEQAERKRTFDCRHQFEPARVLHLKNMEEKPWGAVVKRYVRVMEEEEAGLWEEFFSFTNLTPAKIHDLIREHEQAYLKHDAQEVDALKKKSDYVIPELFKKNIASMCVLFGIPKDAIQALYDPDSHYPYSVSSKSIQANNQGMQVYDPSLKFVQIDFSTSNVLGALAHEMWHILYQDRYLEWMAKNVFKRYLKADMSQNMYQDFCKKFHYFVERRADILAGLQGPFYCDGWANYLTKILEHSRKKGEPIIDEDALHPAHEVRIEYLNKLNDEMARAAAEK